MSVDQSTEGGRTETGDLAQFVDSDTCCPVSLGPSRYRDQALTGFRFHASSWVRAHQAGRLACLAGQGTEPSSDLVGVHTLGQQNVTEAVGSRAHHTTVGLGARR